MPPESIDTTAGSQNTDTSAGTENTDIGQGAPPPKTAPSQSEIYSKAMRDGEARTVKRLAAELGLAASTRDELVAALRGREHPAEADPAEPEQKPKLSPSDARRIAAEQAGLRHKLEAQAKEITVLRAQADLARTERLRGLAAARGISGERQQRAFLADYGRLVRFDDRRELEVVDDRGDPTGQPVREWLAELMADPENAFLLAPRSVTGAGSAQSPTGPPSGPDELGMKMYPQPARRPTAGR